MPATIPAATTGQTVTVGDTDPSTGDDSSAVQGSAGKDAASVRRQMVTSDTPAAPADDGRPPTHYAADTQPPLVDIAASSVNRTELRLVYSEVLDARHLPAASAFAVTAGGQSIAVSGVAVASNGSDLVLTLARAVTSEQEVLVSYTDPTAEDDAHAVQDAVGHDAASFSNQQVANDTAAPDRTAPTLSSIVVDKTSLRTGQTATVTFTFSEAVDGFTAIDVNVPNGTLTDPLSSDNGITWTATLTPTSNVEDASNQITVKLSDLTDLENNAGSGISTASNNYAVDTKAPAIDTATVNGDKLVLRYTEDNGLDARHTAPASAFAVLVNGTANAVTNVAVDATAKTVTLTLTSAVTAGQTVTVDYTDPSTGDDANAVQDSAGNDAASVSRQMVTQDTPAAPAPAPADDGRLPTLEISVAYADGATAMRMDTTATVTFAFSEVVSGFTLRNVSFQYGMGSLSNLQTSDDGKTWTATLTPLLGSEGDDEINVYMRNVRDAAGNRGSDATASASFTVDTRRPNATITLDDTKLVVGAGSEPQSTGITVTFREAVSGTLTAGDFSCASAAVSNLQKVSDTVWTATLTPTITTAKSDIPISVNLGGMRDGAGNAGIDYYLALPKTSFSTDARPTIDSIVVDKTSLRTDQTATVTFTFSEAVDGFTAEDALGNGGVLTDPVSNDEGITWTATLTPPANLEDESNTITVNLAGVTDRAGNAGAGTSKASNNYAVDTKAPAIATATVDGSQLVLTYTEGNGLDDSHKAPASAFAVKVNGTANAVTDVAVDAAAKTVTLTLTTAVTAGQTVTVDYTDPSTGDDANAVQDSAGNDAASFSDRAVTNNTGGAAPSPSPPSATFPDLGVSLSEQNLTASKSCEVSITNRAGLRISGLTAENFTVGDYATISNVRSDDDGLTWKATLSAKPGIQEPADSLGSQFVLRYGGLSSSNGATGSSDDYSTADDLFHVDGRLPTISSIVVDKTSLRTGQTATVTFTFSEAVTGFTAEDALGKGGVLTDPISSDDGITWTGTLTPPANREEASNTITVNLAGITDLAGNAGVGTSKESNNYAVDTRAPLIDIATSNVTGTELRLVYGEALDSAHLPAASAFAVTAGGQSIAVSGVALASNGSDLLLTLASAVTSEQEVRVSYTDPSADDDANAVQDAAGNDAASFSDQQVANDTAAGTDRTAPTVDIATSSVNGTELRLVYDKALDAAHLPAASAFAVTAGGQNIAVSGVALASNGSDLLLTLASAVTSEQEVRVSYTDPSADDDANAVQDAAGNDAASFSDQQVANDTAAGTDRTAPTVDIATSSVNGTELRLVYDKALDAAHLPAASAFAVTAGGQNIAVSGVALASNGSDLLLTLASAVTSEQEVRVSYTDPSADDDTNAVQDAAGNDAASFSDQQVANDTAAGTDRTAPTVDIATSSVNGTELRLVYDKALDAAHLPAASAFAVTAGGQNIAVSGVALASNGSDLLLTLASAVAPEQEVRVSYTDPSADDDANAVQDAAGNDAASFSDQQVANDTVAPDRTAPTISSIVVDKASLRTGQTATVTFTFSEAVTGFTAEDALGKGGILTDPVSSDQGITWTATLTPPANQEDETNVITVNLAGITDLAGNAGSGTSKASNNYAVDTRPPLVDIATSNVTGTELRLVYSEALDASHLPAASAFAVTAGGQGIAVSGVALASNGSDLLLTLASAVAPEQEVRVSYTDPSADDDANAVQDAAGNDAASFSDQQVANDTVAPDRTAPTISSIVVDKASLRTGQTATVTFTFSEAVTGFTAEDALGKGGVLTDPVSSDEGITWTATLTPPANREDATNTITVNLAGITDLAGNAGSGTSKASNNYAVDTKAPAIDAATVNGDKLELRYTEGNGLDASNPAAASAFAVLVDGTANAVTDVAVDSAARTVTLTLTSAVTAGQSVTVGYTDPSAEDDANAVQDAAGNDAASFSDLEAAHAGPAPAPAPTPAPAPAPTPAPEPEPTPGLPGLDSDSDGVSDTVEDQAPGIPGPHGAGALTGDGNGDGVLDSKQPTVASVSVSAGDSGQVGYLTLVLYSDENGKPRTDVSDQARIVSLTQQPAPENLPKAMEMPIGLLDFSAEVSAGTNAGLSLYADPALHVNGYWMQDQSGAWMNLASTPYDGKLVTEGGRLRLDFYIQDGGQFDSDGQANGVIQAPVGAAAYLPLSIVGHASDVVPDGYWF